MEIIETGLEDERRRIVEYALGVERRLPQQVVHGAPGGVIADGDGGVEDEAASAGKRAVIENLVAQDSAVRDDDLHILDRADPSYQQTLLDDVAHGVRNLNPIAAVVGPHVRQDQSRQDVAYGGTRPERKQQTDEQGDALESIGVPTRQVGKHDDERDENQEQPRQLERGPDHLWMNRLEQEIAALDRFGQRFQD